MTRRIIMMDMVGRGRNTRVRIRVVPVRVIILQGLNARHANMAFQNSSILNSFSKETIANL
jgi:hypothetical protein